MSIEGVYLGCCDKCGKIEQVKAVYYPPTRDEPAYTDFIDSPCDCGGTISADNMCELTKDEETLLEQLYRAHELAQAEKYALDNPEDKDKVDRAMKRMKEL